MRRFLRFGPRFLLRWRGPEDQTDVTSAKLTTSWTHALPNTGQIQLSCYGVPHPTLFGRCMCLTPLRRCRSLLHRSLLPRRHWRCSSALPIRPCMSGGINFPRGEEEEGDDATATQNNEWSLPNGRKRGLRARSEEPTRGHTDSSTCLEFEVCSASGAEGSGPVLFQQSSSI